jgi:hypothetical protein
VRQLLDAMTGGAALVRNGRVDYLAANQLGRALFTADEGLILNAFTAEPHSPSADALNLLASCATPVSRPSPPGPDGSRRRELRCAGRR